MKIFRQAVLFAFVLLLFCWAIQLENSLQFITVKGKKLIGQEFLSFLLGQQQNLIFFGFSVLLFALLAKMGLRKRALTFIFFLMGFYLILNQLFYQVYFDHFRLNFDSEGQAFGIKPFLDSILSIINLSFYLNLSLLLASSILLLRLQFKSKNDSMRSKTLVVLCTSLILLLGYGIAMMKYEQPWRNLEKNPFISLLQINTAAAPNQLLAIQVENQEIVYVLKFGEVLKSKPVHFQEYTKQQKNLTEKPNILYFVLESVGAYNLLLNGSLDASLTPNLIQWQKNSLLFNRVYNTFPGTTRSHIPIQTGGKTITWGTIQDEMLYDYTGPTLSGLLQQQNYSTALFSTQFLEYGELLNWYNKQSFDVIVNPDSLPESFVKKHHLNSWGIEEEAVIDTLNQWIKNYDSNQPFFVEFMNSGTHHPYSVPETFRTAEEGEDNLANYRRAIQYMDSLIGLTIKTLQQKGILENTIICISGDHGQAFGKRHYENHLHKNYIYEENIRNFLLIIDPSNIDSPIVSNRSAFIGDIMPTLLAYTDSTIVKNIQGQNLLDSTYEERIHYFHKSSYPELWGLVDGRWKFIEKKMGQKDAQLFDLHTDEGELNNLADLHPEKVNYYRKLLPSWYLQTNRNFRASLLDYNSPNDKSLTVEDITTEGIKFLEFVAKGKGKEFVKKKRFHPKENIIVWLQTSFFPENKQLEYRWTSPSGKLITSDLYFDKEWVTYWRVFEREEKLEEGLWTCGIFDGDEELISNTFEVAKEEQLTYPYIYEAGPIQLLFGVKTEKGYINLEEMHPNESIIAFAQINPYKEDQQLLFEWQSPSLERSSYLVDCQADWNYTWLSLNEGKPMEEGIWKIKISNQGEKLIESSFSVSSAAKLYQAYTVN